MHLETKSTFILILVTAIWGWTFILVQQATHFISPQAFVFLRMLIAGASFLPIVFNRLQKTTQFIFFGGLLLALLNSSTYIFQTEGLQTIPAARSAFITGFGVVLVPLLSPLFRMGRPKKIELIAAACCVIGLYILTGANLRHLGTGDFWSLACAFTYAVMIICLQIISRKATDNLLLSFYMTSFGFIVPFFMFPDLKIPQLMHWEVIIPLLFCAVLATSLVTFLMTRFQQHVSVSKAAIIYALEPVFTTLFAFLFYHQIITLATLVGGGIICLSIALPNIKFRQFSRPFKAFAVRIGKKLEQPKSNDYY